MKVIDKVAWIELRGGEVLSTRSHGKDAYYFPGGKREAGESDLETLAREIGEELAVVIDTGSAEHVGTFEAQAHGQASGVMVRMSCYTAGYEGTLTPSGEIAELIWLTYADRDRVSPVDQIIFDHLHERSLLG